MEGNLDMVKFIVGMNQIDIALALSAQVSYQGDDEVMEKLFSSESDSTLIKEPKFFQDLCEEQQSFGLLIACCNQDK